MNQRIFLGLIGVTALAAMTALAQTSPSAASKSTKAAANSKTPWGEPDLQGTWTSDDTWGVPFERPKNFGTRATLTEDEMKDRAKNISRNEEFVESGGENHSPAKAQIDAAAKGTLGRICAQAIAADFADCRSAGWQASPIDARGAGLAGR
jgi:hypothetical protein